MYLLYIFFIFSLYIFTFNPIYTPLGGFGWIKLLYPLTISLISVTARENYRHFSHVIKIYVFVVLYCGLIALGTGDYTYLYTHIINCIEVFILPICIATLAINKSVDLRKCIFGATAVGAVISLVAFLNSTFSTYLRSVQPVLEKVDAFSLMMREFGFSSELYSGYGWAMGIALIYFLKEYANNKWFIPFVPIACFAILINARSGFLIVIVGLFIYAFMNGKFRNFLSILLVSLVSLYIVSNANLSWINDETMNFIHDFFEQLKSIFEGNDEDSYVGTYTGRMLILPDDAFQWVFGRGKTLMYGIYGVGNSDIGYLNDLALGGLIYVCLSYSSFYKLIKMINIKWFYFAIIITVILLNIKGSFLHTNGGIRIIALIIIYEYLLSLKTVRECKRFNL